MGFSEVARLWVLCLLMLVVPVLAGAQTAPATPPAPARPAVEAPKDPLGRNAPRGTVMGFLNAARKGENELARQYLDTRLSGKQAEELAHQLYVVLDVRLPPRLSQLSDESEGSRVNPLLPNLEPVGTVSSEEGPVDIVLERVTRGANGAIWLFSSKTLTSIPAVYEEILFEREGRALPRFLTSTRVGGIRLLEWGSALIGLGVLYLATVLLNRLLTPLLGLVWRRTFREYPDRRRNALPAPARLLLLALLSRWLLSSLPVSLAMRQFWASAASLITIATVTWLLILLTGEVERYIRRRIPPSNTTAAGDLVRLARRGVDILVILGGLLATLRHFGVDATPALAGLGVGGIAVALAAQKTLENVIAGASLIFDQAVRVGDTLKMGDVVGTVDHIGLRSTRIRTLDRTIVSIPNGQIASASLETLSARDKYKFRHVVGLRYETTSDQLRAVVDGIRRLLDAHPSADRASVRVRFFQLGSFSLDLEIFAYLFARDWDHFLEIQEALLFKVTETVERAGAAIAFPSQTMYVANDQASVPAAGSIPGR